MDSYLLDYLVLLGKFAYLLIFIGIILEGDIVLFASAFLAYNGFFNKWYILFIAFFGAIIGDFLWYKAGYRLNNLSSLFNKFINRFKFLDNHLTVRPFHTIFISKFTYGFHRLLFMRAGILNFDLVKLFKYDLISVVVWLIIVWGLGYFSGASFLIVKKYFRFTEIGLLVFVLIFFILEYFLSKRSKKEL
ncbi:MAG: VTT domain-containing protein [Patescibacteria group bacterium]|mgnify:CR=1 FL=1